MSDARHTAHVKGVGRGREHGLFVRRSAFRKIAGPEEFPDRQARVSPCQLPQILAKPFILARCPCPADVVAVYEDDDLVGQDRRGGRRDAPGIRAPRPGAILFGLQRVTHRRARSMVAARSRATPAMNAAMTPTSRAPIMDGRAKRSVSSGATWRSKYFAQIMMKAMYEASTIATTRSCSLHTVPVRA